MSRKNIFSSISPTPAAPSIESGPDLVQAANPPVQRASAVTAFGRILDTVDRRAHDIQRELDAAQGLIADLRDQIRNGSNVQEIDPALIDPSPIRDRLEDTLSTDNQSLRLSIKESGQRVPALLRHNPNASGRYLTVFGHRRVAAAKELGLLVKAVVADIPEDEALVAQGQENNERSNTSFIERCLFALRLKTFGLKGVQITAAISTDKTSVSKMIDIAEKVPEDIIAAIGPAPNVGRPRWQALAEALPKKVAACRKLATKDGFQNLGSDERFQAVFLAATNSSDQKLAAANFLPWADRNGAQFALVKRTTKGEVTMRIPKDDGTTREDGRSFGEWLESRITSLRDEWLDGQ